MVCLLIVNPTEPYVLATADSENANALLDQELTDYESYLELLGKWLIVKPIEKIGVVGPLSYIPKIMEEIKIKFPKLEVVGETKAEDGQVYELKAQDVVL